MIALPAALPLLERLLDRANETYVLVDGVAQCEDVLLCLAVVEVADAELEVGQTC